MSIRNEIKHGSKIKEIRGHDVMDLQRFAADTKHMIIFDVLTPESEVGTNGERLRAFLSDDGYERAERIEDRGDIIIIRRYRVHKGDLTYIPHKPKYEHRQIKIEL